MIFLDQRFTIPDEKLSFDALFYVLIFVLSIRAYMFLTSGLRQRTKNSWNELIKPVFYTTSFNFSSSLCFSYKRKNTSVPTLVPTLLPCHSDPKRNTVRSSFRIADFPCATNTAKRGKVLKFIISRITQFPIFKISESCSLSTTVFWKAAAKSARSDG